MAKKDKLIVAVSGGVDSVVLLDMLVRAGEHNLIVAHIDHGIRPESAEDARFVRGLAQKYSCQFEIIGLGLGSIASEDLARQKRYQFLFQLSKKHDAKIATGHHCDDVIGSVAINLHRGTGWRGLAVMNRAGIVRPLLSKTKAAIYNYALKNRLEWAEDKTNSSPKYLRNRLRASTINLPKTNIKKLTDLRDEQVKIAAGINSEAMQLAAIFGNNRYPFAMINSRAAKEILRVRFPHLEPAALERALLAIKTARPGTQHEMSKNMTLTFTRTSFVAQDPHQ
jgi:tRNA(Ile)-lysidine synthase